MTAEEQTMTILTPGSERTLGDQIVDWYAARIDERLIRPGARMPSVRRFSAEHRVSRFTVVESYDRLIARGYLESRRGSGFYVRDRAGLAKDRAGAARSYPRRRAGEGDSPVSAVADGRRREGLLRAVRVVLLPEVLAVDELEREPQPAVPGVVRRLEVRQHVPGRRAEGVEVGLGFARVDVPPERAVAVGQGDRFADRV